MRKTKPLMKPMMKLKTSSEISFKNVVYTYVFSHDSILVYGDSVAMRYKAEALLKIINVYRL